jgi:hypothetical protein
MEHRMYGINELEIIRRYSEQLKNAALNYERSLRAVPNEFGLWSRIKRAIHRFKRVPAHSQPPATVHHKVELKIMGRSAASKKAS